MHRIMVGLLAAVAAAMAVLASLAHGYLLWLVAVIVAAAAGLVGYATASDPLPATPLGLVVSAAPATSALKKILR
jgi:hypothetical protein